MDKRMKALRESLGYTQQELADILKIPRSNIAGYETGKRSPSESVISLLCQKFNVNEVWLRTGEGGPDNMFTKISEEDEYSLSLGKLTLEENRFVRNAVNYLANADPEKLKIIEDFMRSCLGMDKNGE